MTYKDILFHLDAADSKQSVARFATSLAAETNAHVTAAGVVIDNLAQFASEDVNSYALLLEISLQSRAAFGEAYVRFSATLSPGVQTSGVVIENSSEAARSEFARLARHFDLCVLSQGQPQWGDVGHLLTSGALFGSGRPVFVVPTGYDQQARFSSAMVCWDGGLQATRALAGALPLLVRCRSVRVVRIGHATEPSAERPAFDIARYLARHGIQAALHEMSHSDDVGLSLLSEAVDAEADFIVMGAYGHWKLRELVLGGTTRTALLRSSIPLLMAH